MRVPSLTASEFNPASTDRSLGAIVTVKVEGTGSVILSESLFEMAIPSVSECSASSSSVIVVAAE